MMLNRKVNLKQGLLVILLSSVLISVQGQDLDAGKKVFDKWCAPCHAAGLDYPGTLALSAKYTGVKSPVLEEWTDLPPELTKIFVRNGISIMPFFRKTEISDAELEDLAAYLARNTR